MPKVRTKFERLQSRDLEYFNPSRDIADAPEPYYTDLKTLIQANGLLRPITVHIFLDDDFDIDGRVVQDGFLRWHAQQELDIPDIDCECHYFIADKGIEIGRLQRTVPIVSVAYSNPPGLTQLNQPTPFPSRANWHAREHGADYASTAALYNASIQAYTDKIADIGNNGQAAHGRVVAYQEVTQNDEGQWLYGPLKSQDDSLLNAVDQATGVTDVEIEIRLIDRRI